MTEQTNLPKTELVFEPEGLVDDSGEQVETEAKAETKAEATPKKLKLKYNGAEEEVTEEEAINLAQMGKNYPKIKAKLDELENAEDRQILSEMAKAEGFKDIPSYVKNLKENTYKQKLEAKTNEYLEQGLPAEHAKRLAEVDLASKPKVDDPVQKSFEELFTEYPEETKDFKNITDFPQEVQDMIAQGKSPIIAFSKYVAKQGKEAERIAKQNEDNAKRDTGSLGTVVSEKEDAFLKGFLGK